MLHGVIASLQVANCLVRFECSGTEFSVQVVSALNSGLVKKEHNPLAESIEESEEDEEEDAPLSPKHHMAKFENQWCALHTNLGELQPIYSL